jgi:hypothetical protein
MTTYLFLTSSYTTWIITLRVSKSCKDLRLIWKGTLKMKHPSKCVTWYIYVILMNSKSLEKTCWKHLGASLDIYSHPNQCFFGGEISQNFDLKIMILTNLVCKPNLTKSSYQWSPLLLHHKIFNKTLGSNLQMEKRLIENWGVLLALPIVLCIN